MLLVEKIKASETEHQKLFAQRFLVLIYNFSPKPRQSSAKFFTLTKKPFLSVVSSSLSLGKGQYQAQQPRATELPMLVYPVLASMKVTRRATHCSLGSFAGLF